MKIIERLHAFYLRWRLHRAGVSRELIDLVCNIPISHNNLLARDLLKAWRASCAVNKRWESQSLYSTSLDKELSRLFTDADLDKPLAIAINKDVEWTEENR